MGRFLDESPTAAAVAAQAPPPAPPAPPPAPPPAWAQNLNRALGTVGEGIDVVAGPAAPLIPFPRSLGETGAMGGGLAGNIAGTALRGVPYVGPVASSALGILGAGLGGAGTAKATGENVTKETEKAVAGQTLGELVSGALRFPWYGRVGNRLMAERAEQIAADKARYAAERAGYKEQVAQDRALRQRAMEAAEQQQAQRKFATGLQHRQATQEQQAGYEAAQQARQMTAETRAEQAAGIIGDHYKRIVPAWQDMPGGTKGLADMVYGRGQQKLSDAYEQAMQQVIGKARGTEVQIPVEVAMRLGLPVDPDVAVRMGVQRSGLSIPGYQAEAPGAVMASLTPVDAELLFKAAQGKWQKEPGAYRAAFNALDEAGIGDPAAREAYKAGQSLIQFTAASKMVRPATSEGPERFDPQKAMNALMDLAKVDKLRKRGMGNIYEGPIPEVSRLGLPPAEIPAPAPIPKPTIPPATQPPPMPLRQPPAKPTEPPMPEGVSQSVILPSLAKHPWMTAGALGGAGSYALGLPGALASGLALIPGTRITTRAPVNEQLDALLRTIPGVYGQSVTHPAERKRVDTRDLGRK